MICATNWHLLRIILIVVYMFSKHLCYNMWIYDMIYDIIIWCMCDLVWYMSIWWYTWSRCDLHMRSRTHLQMRSSLIFDDMSIWCTRTSSRDFVSFLWELYAPSIRYYTTKSRNSQPLRILGDSCTWQRPRSMLRSLSPQVSERFIGH